MTSSLTWITKDRSQFKLYWSTYKKELLSILAGQHFDEVVFDGSQTGSPVTGRTFNVRGKPNGPAVVYRSASVQSSMRQAQLRECLLAHIVVTAFAANNRYRERWTINPARRTCTHKGRPSYAAGLSGSNRSYSLLTTP